MRVELLVPDAAPDAAVPDIAAPERSASAPTGFAAALDALGGVLTAAQRAEDAFAHGGGTLQDAVYERARADVALSVAVAAAQRTATAMTAILGMQL